MAWQERLFYSLCLHIKHTIPVKSADLGLTLFSPLLNTSAVMKHSACSSVTSTEKKVKTQMFKLCLLIFKEWLLRLTAQKQMLHDHNNYYTTHSALMYLKFFVDNFDFTSVKCTANTGPFGTFFLLSMACWSQSNSIVRVFLCRRRASGLRGTSCTKQYCREP